MPGITNNEVKWEPNFVIRYFWHLIFLALPRAQFIGIQ